MVGPYLIRDADSNPYRADSLDELIKHYPDWYNESLYLSSSSPEIFILGMIEEVGELAHALLKYQQGIRGISEEEFLKSTRDGIADLCIFLIGFVDSLNREKSWAFPLHLIFRVSEGLFLIDKSKGLIKMNECLTSLSSELFYGCDTGYITLEHKVRVKLSVFIAAIRRYAFQFGWEDIEPIILDIWNNEVSLRIWYAPKGE